MLNRNQSEHIESKVLVGYFCLGVLWTLMIVAFVVHGRGGGLSSVLWFSSTGVNRVNVEAELGPTVFHVGGGHDGQYFWAIARSPFALGTRYLDFGDNPGYRYRRILYPLLAGGAGRFSGYGALIGLVGLTAVGFGLCLAAQRWLCAYYGVGNEGTFFIIANPGALFALVFMTADIFALGLSLTGVALWQNRSKIAGAAFLGASVLCKEYYILTPLALGAVSILMRNRRDGISLICCSVIPITLWSEYVHRMFGSSRSGSLREQFVPFKGIIASATLWPRLLELEHVLPTVLSLLGILLALLGVCLSKDMFLRLVLLFWLILALCADASVWNLGNNSSRAFISLWSFGGLAVVRSIWPRFEKVPP